MRKAVAEDAAVMRHVAIEIGGALPRTDRGEMLRLQRRGLPLILGIIGDSIQSDLATGPRLDAGPFHAGREVLCFPQGPDVQQSRRSSCTAAVDADANIAIRNPFLGIDDLPVLILVGRASRNVRMGF